MIKSTQIKDELKKSATTTLPVHYVIWRIGIGGIELGVNHFVEEYSNRRKLSVFGLRATENTIYDESKVDVTLGGNLAGNTYINYFKYCRKHRHDLFHLLNAGPIVLLLTLLAGAKRPLYHIRGTIYWTKPIEKVYLKSAWILSWLLAKWTGKIDFVCNSKHSTEIFQDKVLNIPLKLIYNGFEIDPYWEKRHLRTELKRMGYIGRLNPGKNVHLVIQLFSKFAAEDPNLELHLAGDGPLRPELEIQAQQTPYADRIIFHGHVQDMAGFYASVDLFLFLSAYESFGNVLAEALLTGLPILTSNVPVFQEIHGGESAFLLGDPTNMLALEHNLAKAIKNYPALAEIAYEKSHYIREQFDVKKHLREIELIYENH